MTCKTASPKIDRKAHERVKKAARKAGMKECKYYTLVIDAGLRALTEDFRELYRRA